MIGRMITMGIGTPSDVTMFILLGLAMEIRGASQLVVTAVYDDALYITGEW